MPPESVRRRDADESDGTPDEPVRPGAPPAPVSRGARHRERQGSPRVVVIGGTPGPSGRRRLGAGARSGRPPLPLTLPPTPASPSTSPAASSPPTSSAPSSALRDGPQAPGAQPVPRTRAEARRLALSRVEQVRQGGARGGATGGGRRGTGGRARGLRRQPAVLAVVAVLGVVGLVGGVSTLASRRTPGPERTAAGPVTSQGPVGRAFGDASYADTGSGRPVGVLSPTATATEGVFTRTSATPSTVPTSPAGSRGSVDTTSRSGRVPAAPSGSSPAPSGSSPSHSSTSHSSTGPSSPTSSTPPPVTSVNLLARGPLYADPDSQAARVAAAGATSAAAAAALAAVPQARWVAPSDGLSLVDTYLDGANLAGRVPVLVLYGVPGRDCGGYSAGGAPDAASYLAWVSQVRSVIAGRPVVTILEPDALAAGGCVDGSAALDELLSTLGSAVDLLSGDASTSVYLDAGHEDWLSPTQAADRLRAAHVARARGFSLNVSNFYATDTEVSFGQQVSSLLGGSHFVVDTSRNGAGPTADRAWCNPAGRLAGSRPGAVTGTVGLDGYLWVKNPGESDGPCEGGPPSGQWFDTWVIDFVSRSQDAGRL